MRLITLFRALFLVYFLAIPLFLMLHHAKNALAAWSKMLHNVARGPPWFVDPKTS
jgi:preprotein translocase subunit YajC